MQTLRKAEKIGKDSVLIYAGCEYATIALDEYIIKTLDLKEVPKTKIRSLMERQKEARQRRER